MTLVERERQRRQEEAERNEAARMQPKTVTRPDRTTFYCDVATRTFQIASVKILEAYPNGDCRVLTRNGLQFTATAVEVFNIRKGDYHEQGFLE